MSACSVKLFHCNNGFHQYNFHYHLKIPETKWAPVKAQALVVMIWYSKPWARKNKRIYAQDASRARENSWGRGGPMACGCSRSLPWGLNLQIIWKCSAHEFAPSSAPSWHGWREHFSKDQETTSSVIINLAIILKLLKCSSIRSFL